jgi:predicted ribosomally synthesized peptide with SipW-like signal peptide
MLKKAFVLALLAIGLLGVAAGISSLAVFTSSASVGSNSFTTGTVVISTAPASALVTFANMAPGDTTTSSLVVTNGGTLQLRYAISSSATNTDAKGLKDQLVLTIKTIDVTTPGVPCDNFDGTQLYTGDLDSTAGALVGSNAQGAQAGRSASGSTYPWPPATASRTRRRQGPSRSTRNRQRTTRNLSARQGRTEAPLPRSTVQ